MERLEYFAKVMKVVTELTEVTDQDILGKSRVREVVDARWMVIYLMYKKGYYADDITKLIQHPERTVNHAIQMFPDRMENSDCNLGNIYLQARQQLL